MILRLKMVFLGLSITASTMISAFDNPLKPIIEIVKAPGIAQKQLGYSNNISDLINNGNTWALVTVLGLKYGYNHFGDKPFKNLGILNSIQASNDYDKYSILAQNKHTSFNLEKKESNLSKANQFELGKQGLIQVIGSIIAYKFLGLAIINPLKIIALGCIAYVGLTGAKKIYDAYNYPEYLNSKIEDNNYIKAILDRAKKQLKNRENLEQGAKQALLDIKDIAQDKMQDLAQKTQDKVQEWKQKAQGK